jgi:hypothetical protein
MRRKVCNGASCQMQLNPFVGLGKTVADLKAKAEALGAADMPAGASVNATAGANATVVTAPTALQKSTTRLFLRKLSYDVTEEKLRAFFTGCGEVRRSSISRAVAINVAC